MKISFSYQLAYMLVENEYNQNEAQAIVSAYNRMDQRAKKIISKFVTILEERK